MKRPLDSACITYPVELVVVERTQAVAPTLEPDPPRAFKVTEKRKEFFASVFEEANRLPVIVLDAEFDEYHKNRTRKSAVQQMVYSYHETSKRGMLLYVCGAPQSMFAHAAKLSADNWTTAYMTTRTLREIIEGANVFDSDDPLAKAGRLKFVYLTSESDATFPETGHFSAGDAHWGYVVGGLIDRNSHKGLCHRKAQSLQISHAKLPLAGALCSVPCKVLTTNHVVAVLCEHYSDGLSWSEALDKVVPSRKVAVPAEE